MMLPYKYHHNHHLVCVCVCVSRTHDVSFPVCGTSPVPVLELRSVSCDVRLQQVLLLL